MKIGNVSQNSTYVEVSASSDGLHEMVSQGTCSPQAVVCPPLL